MGESAVSLPRDRRSSKRAAQGLLTILLTDIESSVRATQRLGDERAQQMVRTHNTIVRRALALNSGTEVKHTGDGILATFTSARRAVACAVAIQEASTFHNETHPELAFSIRIGLNAGEPVTEDEDIFGTAVQLAARVCARAEPGAILVSDVVRQLVAGKGVLFADMGPVELKGFEESVRLYEIRSEAGAGAKFLDEREGRLSRLLGSTPGRIAIAVTGLAAIVAALVTVAVLLTSDGGGESPSGAGDAAAPSHSPSVTPVTAVAVLAAADTEEIRDLIDRYGAKRIEALRTQNLAGLDAFAIGEAFTQLADAVEDAESREVVVESTRESIAVEDPLSTGLDMASAETLSIWTNCVYKRDGNDLTGGQRSSYKETYYFVRSGGRWYVERVESETLGEEPFKGCEACEALRSGCEAVVVNVTPLDLFVRVGPSRSAEVKARLPEGTSVCVSGTSSVADGLTWWPLRATIDAGPVEGWSADHEPNPPGAVLLEATGERCVVGGP